MTYSEHARRDRHPLTGQVLEAPHIVLAKEIVGTLAAQFITARRSGQDTEKLVRDVVDIFNGNSAGELELTPEQREAMKAEFLKSRPDDDLLKQHVARALEKDLAEQALS